jgi:hypothetical protein
VNWPLLIGLGALWLGVQIIWVAPRPRQLRKGKVPSAPAGTPQAFLLFWIDQFGWLGIALTGFGIAAALIGLAS